MAQETVPAAAPQAAPEPFSFETVRRLAADLATRPSTIQRDADGFPADPLPDVLRYMDYEDYQKIQFKARRALWRSEPDQRFQLQLFHRGYFYRAAMRINLVEQGQAEPLSFSPDLFFYGDHGFDRSTLGDVGFAGFRIHYEYEPLEIEEVAVFLGASYVRGLGKGGRLGTSARLLALETGLPKPEEFPYIREVWIEKPAPGAGEITVHALIDSESATGAARLRIIPGEEALFHVDSNVFLRSDIERLGAATLTSMFHHGENTTHYVRDFRPEVHDADGLLLQSGAGEWVWRPLTNPGGVIRASFDGNALRGFGLLQRDRDFASYQDLEALYHLRPSVYVEPAAEWTEGTVELLELTAPDESFDNVVALWAPAGGGKAGSEHAFSYQMRFGSVLKDLPPDGRTVATRLIPPGDGDRWTFIVDFAGGTLADLKPWAPIQTLFTASAGRLDNVVGQKNEEIGGWRVRFDWLPEGSDGADFRGTLRVGADYLTETWTYQLTA